MKKTYVTPQMETFSIETQGFLAASANVEIGDCFWGILR